MTHTRPKTKAEPVQLSYTVVYERAEEGGFLVHVPVLNGITTDAETLPKARAMAKDMVQGYIESLLLDGINPPLETPAPDAQKVTVSLAVKVA